jgi:hypothetical protein
MSSLTASIARVAPAQASAAAPRAARGPMAARPVLARNSFLAGSASLAKSVRSAPWLSHPQARWTRGGGATGGMCLGRRARVCVGDRAGAMG